MPGRARGAALEGFAAGPDHDVQRQRVCHAGQHGVLGGLGGRSPARQEHPKGRLVQVGPQWRGLVVDGQADQLVAEGGPAFSAVADQTGSDQGLQGPGRLGGAVARPHPPPPRAGSARPGRSRPAGTPRPRPPTRTKRESSRRDAQEPLVPPARSGKAWPAASSAAT